MRTLALLLVLLPACAHVCPTGWSVNSGAKYSQSDGWYEPSVGLELSGEIGETRCKPLDSE